jgi:acyl carrier protein
MIDENASESVVLKIITEELEVEPEELQPSVSLVDDLHADSLALINIVMKIEETFKIDVPDGDWRQLGTIGDIVAYVRRMTSAASPAKAVSRAGE